LTASASDVIRALRKASVETPGLDLIWFGILVAMNPQTVRLALLQRTEACVLFPTAWTRNRR